jgi:hypothetical protein
MYCQRCGQKLNDNDQFCPHCGLPIDHEEAERGYQRYNAPVEVNDTPAKVLGILSLVFAIPSMGYLGIILGIIGACLALEKKNRFLNLLGIFLSSLMILLSVVFMASLGGN